MTGRIALLLGLFGAPGTLLWLGHRLRDRTRRQRAAFWGGAIGHSIAMLVTVAAALFPPIWWHEGGPVRDFAVHWSLLIGFVAGTGIAVLRAGNAPAADASDRRTAGDRRAGNDRRGRRPAPAADTA